MNPAPVSCLCARRYVGPHSQHLQHLPLKVALAQLSPVEKETRRIAYAIKEPRNAREITAAATGLVVDPGRGVMDLLLG